jgi:bifunctional non-homologous end joining protein LigD
LSRDGRSRRAAAAGQLSLDIPARGATLPYRIAPMTPVEAPVPFDDPDWFFEPWWPGAPTLCFLQGDHVRLQTPHMADPAEAFPELAVIRESFDGDGLLVDGFLLVLDEEGRPDQELLRARLSEDPYAGGQPAFVASDLLYEDNRPLISRPFGERRERLARQLTDTDRCVISRGLRGEGLTLAQAVASMGIGEISARLLNAPYRPGIADEAWLRMPVVEAPAAETRPLLYLLQRLPL